MKWMEQQSRYENAVYAALWGILFAAPVMSLYFRVMSDSTVEFDWQEVFMVWRKYLVFLVLFLIHNFLLAPMLVYRQRRWFYAATTAAMLGAFIVYQCNNHPEPIRPHDPTGHQMERRDPPPFELHEDGMRPDDFKVYDDEAQPGFRHHRRKHVPPVFIGQHDIIATVILILMLGMNLGVKLYFKTRKDQKKLVELEKQNLEQQLEYLKYQINPHFFMNTLNNIHALVDIDPEKAKHTILELSKMMRFVLYEGNKAGVPLDREIAFMQNYITLMKLRYTDKVRIQVELPDAIPNKEVPPLMFITFVENAFKHGVSYQQESFIEIKIEIGTHLLFTCRNSRIPKEEDKHGGVGLANVRQRLDLLYGKDYTLDIKDENDAYTVNLTIPL